MEDIQVYVQFVFVSNIDPLYRYLFHVDFRRIIDDVDKRSPRIRVTGTRLIQINSTRTSNTI